MDAVRTEHLSVTYGDGKQIIQDLSLSVPAEKAVVLSGPSGCGKSTLCSAICGLLPEVIPGKAEGEILLFGESIRGKTVSEISRYVGMVFQNPDDQLICTTVIDEIAFGLENLCVEPDEIRRRVEEQLEYFRLTKLAMRSPSELSGGQKKLVTIASVLVMNPKLLILDEPMTGLDEAARGLVKESICRLKADGRSLLIVEHWLEQADYADLILSFEEAENWREAAPKC